MSKIEVDTIDKQSGSTLTVGGPGTAVTLGSGATQTGFGRTGTVDWCTTAKTSPFTAVSGDGFFVDTSSGAVTITLPASPSAGDIVAFKDYANTWDTNNVTLARNGSKINGVCGCGNLNTESQSVTLIYVDGTKGWQDIHDSTSDVSGAPSFIVATGGTITTSGDFKIHTFTGDSTFTINSAPTPANNKVSYMVVAGGGGAGNWAGGGGGAGGFREGKASTDPYTASPLAATPCSALTLTTASYPITIGAGGAGQPTGTSWPSTQACAGTNSVFSTITSTGGGYGGSNDRPPNMGGGAGGSGGGASRCASGVGGAGNTPPVSPPQGNNGGTGTENPPQGYFGGGGGGATAVGADAPNSVGANGGAGATSSINGTPTARAGGGGAGTVCNGTSSTGGAGGGGNGGTGGGANPGSNGTANTGGGGGGAGATNPSGASGGTGGTGGSGVIIIRYKFQ